jgi:outer membrane protein OmpA-like peptidoglycan-associated protein
MLSVLAQKDNPDCADKDYDLFTNLEGFYIDKCETAEFKTLEFWVEANSKKVTKDGKYTKLWYRQSPQSTRSIVGKQIVANYANAVKKARGTVVKNSDDMAYHVTKNGKSLWIALSVSPHAPQRTEYYIEIVEEEAMKQEITANIEEALAENGKIALYGIYFDVNKAVIKSESEPAIKEIADYLTKNPKSSIFIVGHTDNTGDYAKNIKLSKDRATAIKTSLVTKYKIATTRLFADGVGPLAPVSSNANEEGRKLNRRVEVVLK